MGQPKPLTHLPPEEYLRGEARAEIRHEYIDGDVFAMAGASTRHNRIALNLAFALRSAARGGPCGIFVSDVKVRINQGERFYYPDVMLACGDHDGGSDYEDEPCLIAEVLSASTEHIDRREKWQAYRGIPSLAFYLLIDSRAPKISWFRRVNTSWEMGILEPGESLAVECPSGYRTQLLFETIYEDIAW